MRTALAIAFGVGATVLVVLLVPPRPSAMDRIAAAAAEDWKDLLLEIVG